MSTATVFDFTPSQFRRTTQRQTPEPSTEATSSIFSDMADGILVLDFALSFAGFNYDARQLDLSIVGLLGNGQDTLEMFDEELAEHLKCSVRTVRRWRAANIKEAKAKRFNFVQITEGEYDRDRKRYEPTKYRFTGAAFVESAVSEARQSDEYKKDRRATLKKAATDHYDEIPNAPPRQRNKKPTPAPTLKIERDFINAAKNINQGRNTLNGLAEHTRAAFMAGAQGEQLRALLAEMQQGIADILQDFPQPSDNNGFEYIPDILAGIPPVAEDASARLASDAPQEPQEARAAETRVRVEEEETRTQDLETWDRTFAGLVESPIRRVEVELLPLESTEPHFDEELAFDEVPEDEATLEMADLEAAGIVDNLSPIGLIPTSERQARELEIEVDPVERAEAEAAFEIGAMVYPCATDGVLLHAEPSPIAERRLGVNGWQYRLDGFTQWRDERLYVLHEQYVE